MCTTLRYELPCGFYQRRYDKACDNPDCTTKTLQRMVLPNGCNIWKYHTCLGAPQTEPTSLRSEETSNTSSSAEARLSDSSQDAPSTNNSTVDLGLESSDESLYMDPLWKRRTPQMNRGKEGQSRAKVGEREVYRVYSEKEFAGLKGEDDWEDLGLCK
jgi:hypothetical protein